MIAEAVSSHTSCDNEIVNVPERGRIDVVTRSLIVKVMKFTMLVKWLFLKWWKICVYVSHLVFFSSSPLLFRQRDPIPYQFS